MARAGQEGSGRRESGWRLAICRLRMQLTYFTLGAAGVLLWLLMQLPLGARTKQTVVVAMAACVALFTVGSRLLTAQRHGRRQPARRIPFLR